MGYWNPRHIGCALDEDMVGRVKNLVQKHVSFPVAVLTWNLEPEN